jgi:branched-chain amino acid transport system substrate-binding protein
MFLAPREAQAVSLMTKLQGLGYTSYALIGGNGLKTPTFAKASFPINGIYATATTIDFNESTMGREFVARFRTKFKAEPVWGAHYAYDTVHVLADTLVRTGSAKAPDLVAGLKKYEANAPVNQQLRFADSGEQRYPDIGVYKSEGGAWVPQIRSSSW